MAFSATFTENSRTSLKKFIAENKQVLEKRKKNENIYLKTYEITIPHE